MGPQQQQQQHQHQHQHQQQQRQQRRQQLPIPLHRHHHQHQHQPHQGPQTAPNQVYPLGNPYGTPTVHARPNFFPVQKRPPIYQTRPQRLEGTFGPPLPPKPEPTHLKFPDEDEYYQQIPQQQQQQHYQPQNAVRRSDDGVVNYAAPAAPPAPPPPVVYKTVRDMEYARPRVILHVKDSGELFVPDSSILNPIVQPRPPATLINTPVRELIRGQRRQSQNSAQIHLGQDQQQQVVVVQDVIQYQQGGEEVKRKEEEVAPDQIESRESQWLPDFTDVYEEHVGQQGDEDHFNQNQQVEGQVVLQPEVSKERPPPPPPPPHKVVFHVENPQEQPKQPSFSFPSEGVRPFNQGKRQQQQQKNKQRKQQQQQQQQQQQDPPRPVRQSQQQQKNKQRKQQQQQQQQQQDPPRPVRQSQQKQKKPQSEVESGGVTPNYKYVLGASYHRQNNQGPKVAPSNPTPPEEDKDKDKFTPEELYALCIKEVPEYLKDQLCQDILDRGVRRHPHAPSVSVVKAKNPFRGIPTELPKQIKQREPPKLAKIRPSVLRTKSRVKVYKPEEEEQEQEEVKASERPKLATTAKPTTTTTTATKATAKTTTTTTRRTTERPTATTKATTKAAKSPKKDQNAQEEGSNDKKKKKPNNIRRIRPPSAFLAGLSQFFKDLQNTPLPPAPEEDIFAKRRPRPQQNPANAGNIFAALLGARRTSGDKTPPEVKRKRPQEATDE